MASGTVVYKSDMLFPHREIYNGASAQTWPMHLESGSFPDTPYKVTSAVIKFDVRNAYASDRHMTVTRGSGDGTEQFGDVPTGTPGQHTESLYTSASYENITSIKTDGVDRWACQLRGGSVIEIVVAWEETEPIEVPAELPEPVVTTGEIETGQSGQAGWTEVAISFDGVDISEQINQCLISMSYTDNEEDEADDLQIKLQDRVGTWLQKWLNDAVQAAAFDSTDTTKGMTINAGIVRHYPNGKVLKTDCGSFELDSVKADGPPSTITIKGTSLPYAGGIRTDERDKAWEAYYLSGIGSEIAGTGGLGFMFDSPSDPYYERVEQSKQTDIAFLQQLCHDNGLSLKVSGMTLIIFDQAKYEQLDPYTNIVWMDGTYTKYSLQTQEGETHYDECRVRYYDPIKKTLYEGSAKAEDYDGEASDHTVCEITDRAVGSNSEAAELASQILRLHNKYEKKCSFTMVGDPMLGAGLTMNVIGFGMWDEKYIISQAKHEVGSSGYTTKITLRTIAEGKVSTESTSEEEDSSGSGSGGSSKNKTCSYEWQTTRGCAVYENPGDTKAKGFIGKGVTIKIVGSVKNSRTKISGAGMIGYIDNSAFQKVEVKK